jgi:hypothetical protein
MYIWRQDPIHHMSCTQTSKVCTVCMQWLGGKCTAGTGQEIKVDVTDLIYWCVGKAIAKSSIRETTS